MKPRRKGEDHASFDALWDVLLKNKNRIGKPLDPAFQFRLREEYQKSLSMLLPIKQKLAAIDCLIDQIVYRLYGLTDEEIAVVEGAGSAAKLLLYHERKIAIMLYFTCQ